MGCMGVGAGWDEHRVETRGAHRRRGPEEGRWLRVRARLLLWLLLKANSANRLPRPRFFIACAEPPRLSIPPPSPLPHLPLPPFVSYHTSRQSVLSKLVEQVVRVHSRSRRDYRAVVDPRVAKLLQVGGRRGRGGSARRAAWQKGGREFTLVDLSARPCVVV